MCGRYATQKLTWREIVALSRGDAVIPETQLLQNFNAAPNQELPIIINRDGEAMGVSALWGLVPHWIQAVEDKKFPTFNAKSETAHEKASFKSSIRNKRFCLVPATHFYEWGKKPANKGVPYAIGVAGDGDYGSQPFMMAGIWREWSGMFKGQPYSNVTFALLTRPAGKAIGEIHHREPIILLPEDHQPWLTATPTQAAQIIETEFPSQLIRSMVVSKEVGKVKINCPELMQANWVSEPKLL